MLLHGPIYDKFDFDGLVNTDVTMTRSVINKTLDSSRLDEGCSITDRKILHRQSKEVKGSSNE